MAHIKLTSKLQIEKEELLAELERLKQLKATEIAKIKKEMTSRLESAERNLKQEQIRSVDTLKDVKEKHNRELTLMQTENQREM
jgi:hypothetical protein